MHTNTRKIRVPDLVLMKERGERIVMLTAYDATMARLFDPGSIEQPGHSGIVGRQHDDSLASLFHQDEIRHSDFSGVGVHYGFLFTTLESQISRLVITSQRLSSWSISCRPPS